MLDRLAGRASVLLLALLLSSNVSAVGLGEMRAHPILGEPIRLEIALLGAEKQKLDASCFRLVQPSSSDGLPWLRRGAMTVRAGASPVLEIRSEVPLREPILQLTLLLGCGHEVSRDYVLMASPAESQEVATVAASPAPESAPDGMLPRPLERRPAKVRVPAQVVVDEAPARLTPRKTPRRQAISAVPDRLVLSGADDAVVGEPSLRLATELLGPAAAKETQREILRLEYRMLMALHEQAASQMATAEKLRNMEGTLVELQARAAEFAQRVENGNGAQTLPLQGTASQDTVQRDSLPDSPGRRQQKIIAAPVEPEGEAPWGLYGLALGLLLGLGGWLGWRKYQQIREAGHDEEFDAERPLIIPDVRVDPVRNEEYEAAGGVDLHFEPVATGGAVHLDLDLDVAGSGEPVASTNVPPAELPPARGPDSVLSISATTLDEHFEANPVMELADIMLSFGRVKGAAQALQEFIDHNPEEALQPWIRLMDVYRMAGMRSEFETVARNLNQHFNVEVQSWDASNLQASPGEGDSARAIAEVSRPQSLEDMPRLMATVLDLWARGDVVGYLYQLLRDNRGGQRLGFALPVVEDILFLIELKETANRME